MNDSVKMLELTVSPSYTMRELIDAISGFGIAIAAISIDVTVLPSGNFKVTVKRKQS